MSIDYEGLVAQLGPDALALFTDMARLHSGAKGDRFFIESRTNMGTNLHFVGDGSQRSNLSAVDRGAVLDFNSHGLLRTEHTRKGTPNYYVTSAGAAFYRWLTSERTESAVDAQTASPGEVQAVEVLLTALRRVDDQLADSLTNEQAAVLAAERTTLEAQIRSPRPNRGVLRFAVRGLKWVLDGAGQAVVGAGVLAALETTMGVLS